MYYTELPPRKHLVTYHSFDHIEGDRVIDESPQRLDGSAVGDVTFGHTGVVGQAARMANEGDYVQISGLSDYLPMDELTVSGWSKPERPVDANIWQIRFELVDSGGGTHQIEFAPPEPQNTWQFAVGTYDGTYMQLWAADKNGTFHLAKEERVVIEVHDFDLEFRTEGLAKVKVDEVRIYKTALERHYLEALFDTGDKHMGGDWISSVWDNDGVPYLRGKPNQRLADTLAEDHLHLRTQLDAILQSKHINEASGEQLDVLGQWGGVRRKEGERDDKYRARIQGQFAAGRSRGTFNDIVETASTIVGADQEDIFVELAEGDEPVANVYIDESDVDDSPLTRDEIESVMQDVAFSSHRIDLTVQQDNAFTVRDDTQVNDETLGLTSDSISTGGQLVSDL